MTEVAVVAYDSHDAPPRVAASLVETGFVVMTRHPIPAATITSAQDQWRRWFEHAGDKDAYAPGPGEQDGYHPMSAGERAVGSEVPDLKEFFHWYPWGRCPSELRDSAARLHTAGSALGAEVLAWVEAHTPRDVAAQFSVPLASMINGAHRTLLRILRYPPLTGREPRGAVRAAAHQDINLLTVLPAADRPGLRVRDRDGLWHDVPADPGTVVINAGDMLQLASRGYYPSATHDVVNPTGDEARRARVSTPLFLEPADDIVLAPGITAFDFLRERLRAIRGVDLARS
jgi:isopenicillin N synthase-like dioxygenase